MEPGRFPAALAFAKATDAKATVIFVASYVGLRLKQGPAHPSTLNGGYGYLEVRSRAGCLSALRGAEGEYFLGCEQAVERGREAGIDGHLHDYLGDLFTAQADVQASLDVNLELRAGIAERG